MSRRARGRPRVEAWRKAPTRAMQRWLYATDPADPLLHQWALGLAPDVHRLPEDAGGLPPEVLHPNVLDRLRRRYASADRFERVGASSHSLFNWVQRALRMDDDDRELLAPVRAFRRCPDEAWTGARWKTLTTLTLLRRVTIDWPVRPDAFTRGRPLADRDAAALRDLEEWTRHNFAVRWLAYSTDLPFDVLAHTDSAEFVDTYEWIYAALLKLKARGEQQTPAKTLREVLEDQEQRGDRRLLTFDEPPGAVVALPIPWKAGKPMKAFATAKTPADFAEAFTAYYYMQAGLTNERLVAHALGRGRREWLLHRTWNRYRYWLWASPAALRELDAQLAEIIPSGSRA